MGRPRKNNKPLPPRVYLSHGQYFFVDHTGKWNPLGRSMGEMYRNLARFYDDDSPLFSMGDLFERYELTVLPKKAEKTQVENSRSLKRLTAVFGEMTPNEVRPGDVYAYRDKRGRTTEPAQIVIWKSCRMSSPKLWSGGLLRTIPAAM